MENKDGEQYHILSDVPIRVISPTIDWMVSGSPGKYKHLSYEDALERYGDVLTDEEKVKLKEYYGKE